MSDGVEYRPVVECPRYQVGSDGSVIGLSGRALRPCLDTYGYPQVLIYMGDGTRRTRKVHKLVIEAFIGPRPSPAHQVAHWDGDHLNNKPSNLRWATARENIADKIRHGRVSRTRGEINGQVKLTAKQVSDIRSRYWAGSVTQYQLAEEYGVRQPTISNIISRTTWSHV